MKRSCILHKLILLFSVIVLPVIIFGLFIQWRSNDTMKRSILSSTDSHIHDISIQINNTFAETNSLSASLLMQNRVKRLANPLDPMDPYNRSVQANFVRDTLNSIKFRNPAVNNIRLYLPRMNICYNTEKAYDYNLQRFLGSQSEMNAAMYEDLLSLYARPEKMHLHNGCLTFLYCSSLENPFAIIEIVYAPQELNLYFEETLLYEDSYYFLFSDAPLSLLTNCEDQELCRVLSSRKELETGSSFRYNNQTYYIFSYPIVETGLTYYQVIPSKQLMISLTNSTRYSIIFSIAVLLCGALFIWGAFRIIRKPVFQLSVALRKIENRDFNTRVENPKLSDFQYLYDSFNSMAEQLDTLIQKELKQTLLLQKSQLKQLQAQINPHFLYNSFFMLNQMIAREMNDSAQALTQNLGVYFQYITRNYQDNALLKEEYEHAAVYANIQGKRFEGRISIHLQPLPKEYEDLSVPRLIFQPILENSFQYGMSQKIRDGLIRVTFLPSQNGLTAFFEDNGETLTDDTLLHLQNALAAIQTDTLAEETTGILNICKRLQLFYQKENCMQISRSPLGGLLVTINLFRE